MTSAGTGPLALVRARTRPPRPVGLRRARLVNQLTGPGAPRTSLVVAPAGCGKSTLLSHVAEAASPAVAWLTVESDLASIDSFLAHLRESCAQVADVGTGPWSSATQALECLDSVTRPTVLVLDDLHTVAEGPSLDVVRLILRHQPEALRLAIGARRLPELGLARLRLSGGVRDVVADDLRFRTWEVEELFRTCHDVRLGAGEVSLLARRTAGWAAGLQLFHLASGGRSPSARAGLLAGGLGGGRLTSQYLAEQVLEQLAAQTRDFVLRTSVLARLSPGRCDVLVDGDGSAAVLRDLERSGLLVGPGLFSEPGGGAAQYRYHDVLQTHLLEQLTVRFGESTARELHRRAGELWLREQAHADAVRSYCLAQDWDAVRQVIEAGGEDLAGDRGSWLDLLPASIHESDPWVALALARRLLADGALDAAGRAYDRAVLNFGALSGTEIAVREQRSLRAWVDPPLGTVDEPLHQLRLALLDPARVAVPMGRSASTRWCAHGLARLVSGRLGEAVAALEAAQEAAQGPGAPAAVEALAVLGQAVTLSMLAHPSAAEHRRRAALVAGSVELPVLERLADGLVRLTCSGSDAVATVDDLVARCRAVGDCWGEALLRMFEAVQGLSRGRTTEAGARDAAERLDQLPAPALAVWARAAQALAAARDGAPWNREQLRRLDRAAAAVGPLPQALAQLALANAAVDPRTAAVALQSAQRLAGRSGVGPWVDRVAAATRPRPHAAAAADCVLDPRARPSGAAPDAPDAEGPPRLRVQVLGGFSLTRDGEALASDHLRPLHRELLRLFCAHSDRVVARDLLVEWFWPGSEPARAQHSLQVAVSELRRLLQPGLSRGAPSCLPREGAGYRLQLVDADDCDARRFERLVGAARLAQHRGDDVAAVNHLDAALTGYGGDLLAVDGSAEWVVGERDRLRELAVTAYERLADLRATAGDHAAATAAARAGVALDRSRDGLWRRLVASLTELEEPAAAAAAQRGYDAVMVELGLPAAGR